MAVDVWLRQPHQHFRDSIANGYTRFVYSREYCTAARLDAVSWLRRQTLSPDVKAELLLVGPQGAAHYDVWSSHSQPKAVYPVWQPDQPLSDLQELMISPVGEMDPSEFESLPEGLRPTYGQEHIVVVDKLPRANMGTSRQLVQDIRMLALSNPHCKLHLHGMHNFSVMFQNGFSSVDFDPCYPAMQSMHIYLPNGINLQYRDRAEWAAYEEWINMLGFQFRQVATDKRVLTAYNIRSAMWAAQWYSEDLKVRQRYQPTMDEQMRPRSNYTPNQYTRMRLRPLTTQRRAALLKESGTDFLLCNGCVHRTTCRLVKADAVCSYKGADTVALADAFGSRNADTIITGLSDLLQMQADRTERAIERESDDEQIDSEVTRMINGLMKNGVMLAKLLKPELNGKGVTVNVGVNGSAAVAVAGADPNQLVANAVAALERQGIPREDITADMIKMLLTPSLQPGQPAIEGTVVRND